MATRIAVIGAGYWGPNLMRNVAAGVDSELAWICDRDGDVASRAARHHPGVRVTTEVEDVLDDPTVDAVAIATPAATHAPIGLAALEAGKHVLIEKPLAASSAEGEQLVASAEERGLVLMCDHTFCYTPPVLKIRDLIADGTVGDVHYIDSVRINLGLVQPDVDVFWDLAPHDLSIFDFVLPSSRRPHAVLATGADPIGAGRACIGYLTLLLDGDAIAHVHVNWLSPTKIRTTIVGGSRRTLVWDDLNPSQRLGVFDRGVELDRDLDAETRRNTLISYRSGDMVAPAMPTTEALSSVIAELVSSIRERRAPLTDGHAGLRVLRVLEAAGESMKAGGGPIPLLGR